MTTIALIILMSRLPKSKVKMRTLSGHTKFSEVQKNELFKFSFGVCNDQPFFMLKGKYGEDFSISLNGEDLEYSKKRLFFLKNP